MPSKKIDIMAVMRDGRAIDAAVKRAVRDALEEDARLRAGRTRRGGGAGAKKGKATRRSKRAA